MKRNEEEDKWWRTRILIDGFDEACSNIASSYLKVGDESMSAIRFFTTSKGKLPHLYYISLQPEPIGTEFEKFALSVTGYLILIGVSLVSTYL